MKDPSSRERLCLLQATELESQVYPCPLEPGLHQKTHMPDVELQELLLPLLSFSLILVLSFCAMVPISPFWNENAYSMALHIRNM